MTGKVPAYTKRVLQWDDERDTRSYSGPSIREIIMTGELTKDSFRTY